MPAGPNRREFATVLGLLAAGWELRLNRRTVPGTSSLGQFWSIHRGADTRPVSQAACWSLFNSGRIVGIPGGGALDYSTWQRRSSSAPSASVPSSTANSLPSMLGESSPPLAPTSLPSSGGPTECTPAPSAGSPAAAVATPTRKSVRKKRRAAAAASSHARTASRSGTTARRAKPKAASRLAPKKKRRRRARRDSV
jgi:hypothetical protein